MRLVAVDSATRFASASSSAAHASAPSWMNELWLARTTTMLASSVATTRALRTISPVIASSALSIDAHPSERTPNASVVGHGA